MLNYLGIKQPNPFGKQVIDGNTIPEIIRNKQGKIENPLETFHEQIGLIHSPTAWQAVYVLFKKLHFRTSCNFRLFF